MPNRSCTIGAKPEPADETRPHKRFKLKYEADLVIVVHHPRDSPTDPRLNVLHVLPNNRGGGLKETARPPVYPYGGTV